MSHQRLLPDSENNLLHLQNSLEDFQMIPFVDISQLTWNPVIIDFLNSEKFKEF